MSLITDLILGTRTSMTESDWMGATKICDHLFANSSITYIELPSSIRKIGRLAFQNSELTDIVGTNAYPYIECACNTSSDIISPFAGTPWYCTENTVLYWGTNNEVLALCALENPSTDLSFQAGVKNILDFAFYPATKDNWTEVVIPDSVEQIGHYGLGSHSLKKITFGKNCAKLKGYLALSSTTTLIFRQPAGMNVELSEYFAYYKSATTVSIYTDNECIRNYDWTSKSVTPTFYSLSEAPE